MLNLVRELLVSNLTILHSNGKVPVLSLVIIERKSGQMDFKIRQEAWMDTPDGLITCQA